MGLHSISLTVARRLLLDSDRSWDAPMDSHLGRCNRQAGMMVFEHVRIWNGIIDCTGIKHQVDDVFYSLETTDEDENLYKIKSLPDIYERFHPLGRSRHDFCLQLCELVEIAIRNCYLCAAHDEWPHRVAGHFVFFSDVRVTTRCKADMGDRPGWSACCWPKKEYVRGPEQLQR